MSFATPLFGSSVCFEAFQLPLAPIYHFGVTVFLGSCERFLYLVFVKNFLMSHHRPPSSECLYLLQVVLVSCTSHSLSKSAWMCNIYRVHLVIYPYFLISSSSSLILGLVPCSRANRTLVGANVDLLTLLYILAMYHVLGVGVYIGFQYLCSMTQVKSSRHFRCISLLIANPPESSARMKGNSRGLSSCTST